MQDDVRPVLDRCKDDLDRNADAGNVVTVLRDIEAQASGPPLRSRFLYVRAIAYNRLGLWSEAIGDLYDAAKLSESLDDRESLTDIYRTIAFVHAWRGQSREAALALLRAIAEGDALEGRVPLAHSLIEAGRLQMEIGHPREARALLRRGLAIGDVDLPQRERQRAYVTLLQALVATGTPETMEEARVHAEGAKAALEGASPRLHILTHLEQTRIHKTASDFKAAHLALAQAQALAPPDSQAFEHTEIAQVRAELLLDEGEAEEAATLLKTVISRYADDDLASREVGARFMLSRALDAMGRADEADQMLTAALRRALARSLPGHIDHARSRIASRGGHERAWRDGEQPAGWSANDSADRFVRRRPIGAGGFASVTRAYDLELGTEVALKTSQLEGVYDTGLRHQLAEAARIEIEAASRIHHPGVARVLGLLSEANDNLVLVEEFVEGPSLRQAMRSLPQRAQALELLSRIAFALAAIHGVGIVHRDLKPDNILLRGGTAPVIIDFGIALLKTSGQAGRAGTVTYMSPEQARGGHLDRRSDLYSFGLVACELLTGELPKLKPGFGPLILASRGTIATVRNSLLQKGLPADLAAFLARMVAPHRYWRPASAAIAARTFAKIARDVTQTASDTKTPPAA